MTPESLRLHINTYLELRGSLGFQTTPVIARDLHKLLDYVIAQGFSWPIRTQTILDWINAVSADCGLGGQRLRLINVRCFLKYFKASAPETEVPGPGLLPRQPRPKPRLYSTEEIAKGISPAIRIPGGWGWSANLQLVARGGETSERLDQVRRPWSGRSRQESHSASM